MDDPSQPPPDRLVELVAHDQQRAPDCLEGLAVGPVEDRKAALQRLHRAVADEGELVRSPL